MTLAAAFPDTPTPADSPDAGRYEHPTKNPQSPVGTLPTGPHAEAEAAALQAAHADLETPERLPALQMDPYWPAPRGLVMFGSVLTADQPRPVPDPLPEPASYSNTSTGRTLAGIDEQIGGNLRARNQFLRAQLRDVTADLARERSQRQDAQARLAAVTAERGDLAVKLAETERALRVLGAAVRHAIGHDEGGRGDD